MAAGRRPPILTTRPRDFKAPGPAENALFRPWPPALTYRDRSPAPCRVVSNWVVDLPSPANVQFLPRLMGAAVTSRSRMGRRLTGLAGFYFGQRRSCMYPLQSRQPARPLPGRDPAHEEAVSTHRTHGGWVTSPIDMHTCTAPPRSLVLVGRFSEANQAGSLYSPWLLLMVRPA